jgi:acetyl-CoA acyltransferase
MASRVVIASAVRTPFTRAHKGEFKDTRPDTLASLVIKEAVARVPGLKKEDVEDVILGCAMPEAEQGMNVARNASLLAGLPDTVPGMTINRFCASGTQSIAQAAQAIQAGMINVAVAGGTESMTMVPMGGNKVSANPEIMEKFPEVYTSMGATAENIAVRYSVTREDADKFAYESQRRAATAREQGKFKDEILPVTTTMYDEDGKAKQVTVTFDTILRPDTTLEGLAKLRPAFNAKGVVTAGNASPLTDGAAATVVMSEEKAKALGYQPLGYIRSWAYASLDPATQLLQGPAYAAPQALDAAGVTLADIDLVEMHEAFAAQVVSNLKAFASKKFAADELNRTAPLGEVDLDRFNVNGGSIAIGHPFGATGARITVQLLHELRRRGQNLGLMTVCAAGGVGFAMVVERE